MYDAEDIIDVYDLHTAQSSCSLVSLHRIGSRLKEIKSTLAEISRRRIQYRLDTSHSMITGDQEMSDNDKFRYHSYLSSSPLVHDGDLVGVEDERDLLLEWVLAATAVADDAHGELTVVSLVGMGGVGKTTLIKKVYNDEQVKRHFERSAWIYVSQSPRLREVFAQMAKGLMEMPSFEIDALSEREMQEGLLRSLEKRRYLLVFDDVWDRGMWDVIKLVLPRNDLGSRVIITTRNSAVASSVVGVKNRIHVLRPLPLEASRTLFFNKAFGPCSFHPEDEDELKETAEEILMRCGGLPLAVVTIGHMMSRKERSLVEWRRVLDNISREFWNDDDDGGGVRRALLMSYNDLPYSTLRSCFLYLSIFPQDSEIPRKRLIRLWIAEGFVQDDRGEVAEDVADKYLAELINRSMIQVSKMGSSGKVKACSVHDLLHQLATSKSHDDNFSTTLSDVHRTMKAIPDRARRLSLHKKFCSDSYECRKAEMMKIRSLFMVGMAEPLPCLTKFAGLSILLRVLDLEDACLSEVPSEVGDLRHLRYLSLKGTKIMKLPNSLKHLSNLQTLDVRRTNLQRLSFGLQHLKQLRHLEMGSQALAAGQLIKAPRGLSHLDRLQVVTGLEASAAVVHEIGQLSQLRKLSIGGLKARDVVPLCSSMNQMTHLSSLSVSSISEIEQLDLSSLIPAPSLHKLHIVGYLGKLPDWFHTAKSLTKLRLGLSRLSEDPFPILQELPCLVFLQLYEAFDGKVMRCGRPGFHKLKILILTGLDDLEDWEVEEGAMPCIQELWIMSCSNLKAIPSGFEFLSTLQKLRLVNMPLGFIKRVNPNPAGEDFSTVQHIPSIQVLSG